ncbi:MAG: permease [Lentisphaerae bacterium RIFOXYA12_FULL_48_11]|nr:MAG: permease [Candidatus Moranbacteria bacterium RIFOXYA2_FULL_43_15]OGV66614.1 MAG: permease [Lentisphaerae bacterium RIFOXYA12_FULL_48_11]
MIQQFADWLTYNIFGLIEYSKVADSINFFVYDSIKIIVLLLVITHFMSLMRYYLPIEKLRDFLASHKFFGLDYFSATIFGAITPFCSCSSIPLFIGFVEAGIPLGVTFAFLITSPLVNEVAVVMFLGLLGIKTTIIYVAAGILIGMVGGAILGKLKMEKYVEDYVWKIKMKDTENNNEREKFSWKVAKIISKEAVDTTKKITLYVLVGVGVGALIHGYVPEGFFEKYITKRNPFAVPLAVILAVPLYSNASGVIPIIQSLVAKGIPLGTAMAFMMATVGLSLPEALILKRVMKLKLLLTFFGVVTLGMILIGYIFNWIL